MKKISFIVLGVVLSLALWYAFRPEKLFINKKVNEAAPTLQANQLTPLFTGRFTSDGLAAQGRVTIFQTSNGSRILRLSDFHKTAEADDHLLLVTSDESLSGKATVLGRNVVDLGSLKNAQGDQDYSLQPEVDITNFNVATIYNFQLHRSMGIAKLDSF